MNLKTGAFPAIRNLLALFTTVGEVLLRKLVGGNQGKAERDTCKRTPKLKLMDGRSLLNHTDMRTTIENCTQVTWFFLLGLTDQEGLKGTLFVLFLLIYSVTLVGNLGMIILIHMEPQLHTPMYFFLSILSFIDASLSTTDTPRLLENFITSGQSISFAGCVVQMALMLLQGTAECLLLAIMAYDRFVAICHPLLYHSIMSYRLRVQLVAATYTASVASSALLTGCVFKLPYCGPNVINHYFCDIPAVLQLACADTTEVEAIISLSSALIFFFTVTIILVSYAYILVTICRMHSLEAQSKALSTCTSHLTIICLLYGTLIFMYTQPSSRNSLEQNKVVSVFYSVIIPMLNPLIYSLRNKDVKSAFKRRYLGKLPS
ncbi:olfactory receptor 476-like [Phyllostomus discolor]|uniref:Olfactory receptor n=1 Tax=Phyllostomus discolor TaxID=89673 RepID=A0A7E6E236_9CHIR|nr:olfactory receptor 476-like [Phyllostomus discolor]